MHSSLSRRALIAGASAVVAVAISHPTQASAEDNPDELRITQGALACLGKGD